MRNIASRSGKSSRILARIAVVAAVALVVTGCGSQADGDETKVADGPAASATGAMDPSAAEALPAKIRERGSITVASTISYPPFQFYQEDGKTAEGTSIELGEALGQELGVELKFENVPFDAIIPGIAAGRYDIAITGMSVTPERSKALNFVTTMSTGSNFLVPADNPHGIKSLADACGLHVAVVKGTTHGAMLKAFNDDGGCAAAGKPIIVDSYESGAEMQALKTSRAAARYSDLGGNAYAAKQSDGSLAVVGDLAKAEPFGIAVGDPALATALHQAFNAMIEDGVYGDILKKWGLEQAALTQSELVLAGS